VLPAADIIFSCLVGKTSVLPQPVSAQHILLQLLLVIMCMPPLFVIYRNPHHVNSSVLLQPLLQLTPAQRLLVITSTRQEAKL
jgi:hypothetical protein